MSTKYWDNYLEPATKRQDVVTNINKRDPHVTHTNQAMTAAFDFSFTPSDKDLLLLSGFVPLESTHSHQSRKSLAGKLRARCIAAHLANTEHPKIRMSRIADYVGMCERNLHSLFGTKSALYAFPPPELAQVIIKTIAPSTSWKSTATRLRDLFLAIENNDAGQQLLRDLATVHQKHPELACGDAFFSEELRKQILAHPTINPTYAKWVGYFTDEIRIALIGWANSNSPLHREISPIISLIRVVPL
jgi:hypothetical protein